MSKSSISINKWSFLLVAVFAAFSFVALADSAHAVDGVAENIYFRIDTEIDVLNAKGVTVEWSCNGTASGSITDVADGIASESALGIGSVVDGIVNVASSSKEMTDSTCAVAGGAVWDGSKTIRAKVSLGGWVTRRWTEVLVASTSGPLITRASMDYTIRVNGVADELGTALTLNGTTASATYDGTVASQSYSNYGGTWRKYIAGSTTGGYVTGGADGYVNRATTSTLTVNATASTSVDFGVTATASANDESGLLFGHKVQVFQYGGTFTDTKLTTGTVLAGNSLGTTCTRGQTTNEGYWYCPVPLAHTGTSAQYTGPSTLQVTSALYTDRSAGSNGQTFTVINPLSNVSGSNSSTPVTPTPTPAPTPTPSATPVPSVSLTPTPTPTQSTPATPASKGFVSLAVLNLNEGDTISATGSDDPDIYIANEWGYKRLFLNPVIFGFYGHLGGFNKVKSTTSTVRDTLVTSGLFRNCETEDPKVYGVETTGEDTGILHWVNTSGDQAVADDADFFKKVFCINTNEFNWYTQGSEYTSVNQVPSYSR